MGDLRLFRCSLTGVDENTDLASLAALSARYPVAEWGFVYSPSTNRGYGRHTSFSAIKKAFESLPDYVSVVLHMVGNGPHELLHGEDSCMTLFGLATERKARVQLDIDQKNNPVVLSGLLDFVVNKRETNFTTKHYPGNTDCTAALHNCANFSALIDTSIDEGGLPDAWQRPMPAIFCGYAGGLAPSNLSEEFAKMAIAARDRMVWVDITNGVRKSETNNGPELMNMALCEAALVIAQPLWAGAAGAASLPGAPRF